MNAALLSIILTVATLRTLVHENLMSIFNMAQHFIDCSSDIPSLLVALCADHDWEPLRVRTPGLPPALTSASTAALRLITGLKAWFEAAW